MGAGATQSPNRRTAIGGARPAAKPFFRNQYLRLDSLRYRTMGDPHPGTVPPIETPETTTLINRARIEHQLEDRKLVS